MKKQSYLILVLALSLAVLVSACGAAQPPATAVPAPTEANQPAVVDQPVQQGQTFAPTCQNVTAACTAPEVGDTVASETTCIQKVPYQLVFVPEGVTFEVLDPTNLTCADNGAVVDGKHVIECHGTQLWTTRLKLTNVACGTNTLQTNTGQCQEGFGFDATQNCCAPVTSNAGNSVMINVNMGGCPDKVAP